MIGAKVVALASGPAILCHRTPLLDNLLVLFFLLAQDAAKEFT